MIFFVLVHDFFFQGSNLPAEEPVLFSYACIGSARCWAQGAGWEMFI